MQIDADLARRFAENSPFLDALEDLRRQLFAIYADEQKPLMLIAPFWDESQPHTVADAGGLGQMRTAITRAWHDAEWSDNFVMLDGYFKRPLRQANRDVNLIKEVLGDLPIVLVHGYLNGDSAFPMISTWNVMPGERIGRLVDIRGQGHAPDDGGKLTQNTFRTQVGESIAQVAGLLGESYHFYASGREPRLDLFANQNPFGEAVTRQWVEGLRLLSSATIPNTATKNLIQYSSNATSFLPVSVVQATDFDGWISSLAFSPNGQSVASASFFGIRVWDLSTGHDVNANTDAGPTCVRCIAFLPNGRLLAAATSEDVQLWDPMKGDVITLNASPFDYDKSPNAIAVSPDGQLLASGHEYKDPVIRLWDLGRMRNILTLEGHTSKVSSVAFSPDGSLLASGGNDKTVRLWALPAGRPVRTLKCGGFVYSVAFSPDGRLLASCGNDSATVWNVASGNLLQDFSDCFERVTAIAFSPDSRSLAVGSSGRCTMFQVADKQEIWTQTTPQSKSQLTSDRRIFTLAFSPDGHLLASGGDDNTVTLLAANSGQEVCSLIGHGDCRKLAFTTDGRSVAANKRPFKILGTSKRCQHVGVWNTASGAELAAFTGLEEDDGEKTLAFSGDNRVLAIGSKYKDTIVLWDTVDGEVVCAFAAYRKDINLLTFSADGRFLASGARNQPIKIWDTSSGELLQMLDSNQYISEFAFSPDGEVLAVKAEDKTIALWRWGSDRVIRKLATGHETVLVAFSPEGRKVMSAGFDGSIRVWDVASGRQLRTLTGQRRWIDAVAAVAGGQLILAKKHVDDLRLWV